MNRDLNNCTRSANRSDTARGRRSLAALTGTALCLASAGVAAQVTAVVGGNPSNIMLSIPVTASIAPRCSFASGAAPGGSYANADIRSGFSHSFTFALQCNSASRVAVQSANGGLLAADARDLAQVLEQSGEAVIVKDLNAVVTYWNREAASLYGFSAAEAIGQPLRKLHAAELSAADYERLLERVRAGRPTSMTTERRNRN